MPGDDFFGISLKFLKHGLEWDYFLGCYQFLFTNFFNVEKKQLISYPATTQYLITQEFLE